MGIEIQRKFTEHINYITASGSVPNGKGIIYSADARHKTQLVANLYLASKVYSVNKDF